MTFPQQRPRPVRENLAPSRIARSCCCTYHREILKRPGLLNVLQSSSQVLELEVDGLLGGLCILDGLSLEGVNGLQLAVDVVGNGFEGLEALLDLVDDGLVLERGPVVGKVDRRGLFRQLLDLATGVFVALLEGLQRGDGLATQSQRAGDLGPVELESCASLLRRGKLALRYSGGRGFSAQRPPRPGREPLTARLRVEYN